MAVSCSYNFIFYNSSRKFLHPRFLRDYRTIPLFLHLSVAGGENFLVPLPPPVPPLPPPLQSAEWWLRRKCFLKNNLSMAELHEWFLRNDFISVYSKLVSKQFRDTWVLYEAFLFMLFVLIWGEKCKEGKKCIWFQYRILKQIYLIFMIYCSDQQFRGYDTRNKKRICLFSSAW